LKINGLADDEELREKGEDEYCGDLPGGEMVLHAAETSA
jgi:hypothetical protein